MSVATRWGRWVTIALVGGAVCTICDHLHATQGVLWYPHPFLWEQAWWVPLLFVAASIAMIAGVTPVRPKRDGAVSPSARVIAADSVALVTAYAFTAFGHAQPNVVLGVLVGFWVARVVQGVPTWVIAYSLICAVVGAAFEMTLSSLGGFHYHHPDALGVPRWLPALYLHAGVTATSVRRLVD